MLPSIHQKIPLGIINISEGSPIITVLTVNEKKSKIGINSPRKVFRVRLPNKEYDIDAGTSQEMESWIAAIRGALDLNSKAKKFRSSMESKMYQ